MKFHIIQLVRYFRYVVNPKSDTKNIEKKINYVNERKQIHRKIIGIALYAERFFQTFVDCQPAYFESSDLESSQMS